MFKFAAIVSLMLIATCSQAAYRRHKKDASEERDFDSGDSKLSSGSSMWAASLSCDSCGSECMSACGTRHFRSCCFNYLRRKRGPEAAKLPPSSSDMKPQDLLKLEKAKVPLILVENVPDWTTNFGNDYRPYPYEEMYENRIIEV